jgi:hypothetical protein
LGGGGWPAGRSFRRRSQGGCGGDFVDRGGGDTLARGEPAQLPSDEATNDEEGGDGKNHAETMPGLHESWFGGGSYAAACAGQAGKRGNGVSTKQTTG